MKNIKLTIQYEGSRYQGWQRQSGTENTIQHKIEQVLSKMTGEAVEIHGSGRTDAGVHAFAQSANAHLNTSLNPEEIMDYLNRYLPDDIGITGAALASPRFHSRLNAKGKIYIYRIWNSSRPNILERKFIHQVLTPLNLEDMQEAASYLTGTHDFSAFTSAKKKKKSAVRTIESILIKQIGEEIQLIYKGNGFLYHMVRILSGTLIEVGMQRRKPEEMKEILLSLDRQKAGALVPASGLILMEVSY